MLNPTANLFLSLRNTLSALADDSGNKYFNFVDQDLGQLDQNPGSGRPSVGYPAALIDLEEITFTSVTENVQSGKCRVRITLVFPPFSSSSSSAPDTYTQKALYYYDLEQIVYQALQGVPPVLYTPKHTDML